MQSNEHKGSLKDKFDGFGAEPNAALWDSIANSIDQPKGSLTEKFDGFGAEPSAGLWDSISGELDGRKKRRGIIWWWTAGLAALILLGFVSYKADWFTTSQPVIGEEKHQSIQEKETAEEGNDPKQNSQLQAGVSNDSEGETIVDVSMTDSQQSSLSDFNSDGGRVEKTDEQSTRLTQKTESGSTTKNGGQTNEVEGEEMVNEENSNPESTPENNFENNDLTQQTGVGEQQQNREDISPTDPPPVLKLDNNSTAELASVPLNFEKRKPKWELSAGYTYLNTLDKKVKGGTVINSSTAAPPPTDNEDFSPIDPSLGLAEQMPTYNSQQAVAGNAERPLNFELLLHRNTNKGAAFFTGLTYSRQYYQSFYNSYSLYSTQSIVTTVGIPLGMKVYLADRPRWGLYTDFSLLSEIPVWEKRTEYETSFNLLEKNQSKVRGIMLSSQLGIGAEYKFNQRFGLRTTVMGRYYYLQLIKNTPPLQKRDLWLGANVSLYWRF
ncbi:MAG: PorT family protein [Flavobacteriales bacterium]|nr:PorT family protein [Flavobacteriales bacterium]